MSADPKEEKNEVVTTESKAIRVKKIPVNEPKEEDFEIVHNNIDTPLNKDQLLIKLEYVSVDPYLRHVLPRMHNQIMQSLAVAKVVSSKSANYNPGDIITGTFPWSQYSIIDQKVANLETKNVIANNLDVPLSNWLGILGLTGITAYYGLLDIGQCKEGHNVLISGAAGAVGVAVGQIAKIKNCHVVGVAGTKDKCQYLLNDLKFDGAINYKDFKNDKALMQAELKKQFPKGIDVYFDNTGGFVTEAVWDLLNTKARVPICGQIANYNQLGNVPKIDDFLMKLIYRCVRVEGFIATDFTDYAGFYGSMIPWIKNKKVVSKETIVNGFDKIPKAFIGLFTGDNVGKMIIDCTKNDDDHNKQQ